MAKAMIAATNLAKNSVTWTSRKWPIMRQFLLKEMKPVGPTEIPTYFKEFGTAISRLGKSEWKKMTVHEGLISFLVTWEVCMWFFAGEVMGRYCIAGYRIEGAEHFH